MRLEAKTKERQELHTLSKDTVKHWENTIEVCFYDLPSRLDTVRK